MILRIIRLSGMALMGLYGQTVSAQVSCRNDSAFIHYLTTRGFFIEKKALLSGCSDSLDSWILYQLAHTMYQLKEKNQALQTIRRINRIDTTPYLGFYFFLLAANNKTEELQKNRSFFTTGRYAIKEEQFFNTCLLLQPEGKTTGLLRGSIPDELLHTRLSYEKTHQKHLAEALTYSALIPGLGKAYLGKKYDFLYTLVLNLALGAQYAESVWRTGYASPRSWITGSLFALSYSANIYGTISLFKKEKKNRQQELIYETAYYLRDLDRPFPAK